MTSSQHIDYLLPAEVARLLHVSPKTVSRWAKTGKLPFQATLGGHRRFDPDAIHALARSLARDADLDSGVR